MKKVLFTATVDSHILAFHTPYLKYFKDKGYEVHVATNGNATIPYCDVKHNVLFERSPLKFNNLKAIIHLKKIIDIEKFEIIHTHTPMGSVVTRLAAMNSRKKNNTRVIYTAHGFHFFKGAPFQYWAMFYPIELLLARITDTLITINREDYVLAKNKFKTDIRYVPGVGIDTKKFESEISDVEIASLRNSIGLKKSDFVMIYPAELSERKRQIWLINTLSSSISSNRSLHILLPGRDGLKGECHKLVNKLGLEKNIHLLGFRNDIPSLLRISNLAVSAARQEGLPVNVLEAMYVNLPVVATNCRGNADLITDKSVGLLVELNNATEMKDAVMQAYEAKRAPKGNRSLGQLTTQYTLPNVLPILSNIYDGGKI